jgi:hypothetical protein
MPSVIPRELRMVLPACLLAVRHNNLMTGGTAHHAIRYAWNDLDGIYTRNFKMVDIL